MANERNRTGDTPESDEVGRMDDDVTGRAAEDDEEFDDLDESDDEDEGEDEGEDLES